MAALNLTCFGTGDGMASIGRNHSAFLYQWPNRTILIDCGEPISRSYQLSGQKANAIDHIVLSHLHFDHVGGFFMLIQGLWIEGRRKALRVSLPEDGIAPMQQLLAAAALFPEVLGFEIVWEPIKAGARIQSGPVQIDAVANTHLAEFKARYEDRHPQRYEAFSFRIEHGPFRAAHTADVGAVADLDPLLAEPLDLLVCEMAHLNPAKLFERLARASIGQIVFTHLSRAQWGMLDQLRQEAAAALGSTQHQFVEDGAQLTVPVNGH